MTPIVDNPEEHRFEAREGDEVAYLTYRRGADHIVLLHTEVPGAMSGKGVGSGLVREALEGARADGRRVVIICPFARAFLVRNPEYQELLLA